MHLFLKYSSLSLLLIIALVGCKSEDDGSTSSSSVTPGVIDAAGGFNVKVNPPTGLNYMIHKAGDFDAPCTVASSAVGTGLSNTFIDCIIEVEELEGAFGGESGISMVMNVPPSMCKYVTYRPYFYFGEQHGTGPTLATVRFDTNGTYVGGSVTGPGYTSPDGTVMCNYDYTPLEGPNCCHGTYTLTTVNNFGDPSATSTTEVKEWTGAPGNCVAGAGSTADRTKDTEMPVTTYYFKPNGFNDEFTTGKRSVIDANSSLYYANYYTGTAPAAFQLSDPNYPANPYYTWYCLDDSEEEIARIRVQIREWNDIDEFALAASGDPDTSGTEASGDPINDFWDWLDVFNNGDAFPGMPED